MHRGVSVRAVCTLFFLSAEAKAARHCVRPTRSRGQARKSARQRGAGPRLRSRVPADAPTACQGRGVETGQPELYRGPPHGRRSGGLERPSPKWALPVQTREALALGATGKDHRLREGRAASPKPCYSRAKTTPSRHRHYAQGPQISIWITTGMKEKRFPRVDSGEFRGNGEEGSRTGEGHAPVRRSIQSSVKRRASGGGGGGRGRPAALGETAAERNLPSGQSAPGLPKYPKESCRRGSSRARGDAGPGALESITAHGEGGTPVSRWARAGGTLKRAKSNDGNGARPRGRDPTATHSLPVYLVNRTMQVQPSGRSAVGIYNGPRADRGASWQPRFRPMYTPGTSRG